MILFSLEVVLVTGDMMLVTGDIDQEFEEFVKNNSNKLTKNQKEICKKLGVSIP